MKPSKCSATQVRHLLGRIDTLNRSTVIVIKPSSAEQKLLDEQQKLEDELEVISTKLQTYRRRVDNHSSKIRSELSDDCGIARTAVHFKSAEEALKAVEELQNKYGDLLE